MWKKEFDTSYVGFTNDGSQWLVDNTDIKLIGTFLDISHAQIFFFLHIDNLWNVKLLHHGI